MLDYVIFANPLSTWLVALTTAALTLVGLALVRRALIDRLERSAHDSERFLDAAVLQVLRRTSSWFFVAVAIALAARVLALPGAWVTFFRRALLLLVLIQLGRWIVSVVGLWIGRHVQQRQTTGDVGSVMTIRALGFGAQLLIWLLLGITALETVLGYDVTALVTGLGIAGIAVALAVQNVLGDLLAALAIMLDKPFVVGDFIVVGEFAGTVEHVGLKTTRIRSLTGEQLVYSNAELLRSTIRNFKRMYERRIVLPMEVHLATPHASLAKIPGAFREIVVAQGTVRFDRSHVAAVTERAFRIETVYHVLNPDFGRHMDIQQAIILEMLAYLEREGVLLARPLLDGTVVTRSAG